MLLLLFVDSDANQATGDPPSSARTTSSSSSGVRACSSSGTGPTSRSAPAIRPRPRDLQLPGRRRRSRSARPISATRRSCVRRPCVLSGVTIDPATGDARLHERCQRTSRRRSASLPVRGQDHAADPRRSQPHGRRRRARPPAGRSRSGWSRRAPTPARSCRTGGSPASGGSGLHGSGRRSQRVQGGAATCTWNIPANAKGKTFRGSVAVVFEGLSGDPERTRRRSASTAACAPPRAPRLSPRSVVAITGTASGSVDRTPRDVVERHSSRRSGRRPTSDSAAHARGNASA